MLVIGHTSRKALPTIRSWSTGPKIRLSVEFVRLSPMTNTWPAGTIVSGKLLVGAPVSEVSLIERLAVDMYYPVDGLELIARQTDDPLDELINLRSRCSGRPGEHDDVSPARYRRSHRRPC